MRILEHECWVPGDWFDGWQGTPWTNPIAVTPCTTHGIRSFKGIGVVCLVGLEWGV